MPIRLRRAILLNDLVLVKRIIKNNPSFLRNPDFENRSNTSLHLCAKHGFLDIAVGPRAAYRMSIGYASWEA